MEAELMPAGSPEGSEEPESSEPRFGTLTPQEAGRKGAQQREANRRKAREAAADAILLQELGFRDRLGIALQALTQEELNGVVKSMARQAMAGEEKSAHVLARLADQAFGRTPPAAPSSEEEETWEEMSRERRAALAAVLIAEAEAELADRSTGPGTPARV